MPVCTITGTLRNSQGIALTSTKVVFERSGVAGQDGAVVIPRSVEVTSDEFGAISVDLYPGVYTGITTGNRGQYKFAVGVPEELTADLADIIDQFPAITPSLVTQAIAARDAAEGYAEAAGLDAIATAEDRVQTGLDRLAAAASAVLADARADDAASFAGYRDYQDVATLLANTSLAYGAGASQVAAGDIIRTRAEGFSYEVAASAATDHNAITTGGVKLYLLARRVGANDVRDVTGIAKGANVIETVSELTDPTLASNLGRRVILAGKPPIMAYCDGAVWWDMTNGAEITPWWLPRGAALHVDFDNSRFYWDGAERVLADLTVEGVGGYSLSGYGFGFDEIASVVLEYSAGTIFSATANGQIANITGTVFSWNNGGGGGNRIEFGAGENNSWGDDLNLYVAPGIPSADSVRFPRGTAGSGGAVWSRTERRRVFARIQSNTNHIMQDGDGEELVPARGSGTLAVPTKIGFGMRAAFNDAPLTSGTLHRVTLYNYELARTHRRASGKTGTAKPVHFLGDSFLNLYNINTHFREIAGAAGKFITTTQDGVGGTSLTQQAARYAAYNAASDREKWWDSTLVIIDGGFDGTPEQGIRAIETMLKYIKHDRWLYVQSGKFAFNPVVSVPPEDVAMKAWCGDHWISTLAEAWALSDGSPTDEAQIATGRWPVSLTLSSADFHPNNAGAQFLAQRVYDELVARGWA